MRKTKLMERKADLDTKGNHTRLGNAWLAVLVVILLLASFSCNRNEPQEELSGSEATLAYLRTLAGSMAAPTSGGVGFQTATPGEVGLPTATSGDVVLPTLTLSSTLFHPTFSGEAPGGQIVFTCYMDGFDQICRMDADGSDVVRLTNVAAHEFYASPSRDGDEIVFSSRRNGAYNIFRMDTDGSDVEQLTSGLGMCYSPEVSPDSTQIVFTVESGGRQNVWVMDRDGDNPHALTDTAGNGDPTWSPDGGRIAFVSNRTGINQLWIINADGSNPRQVTDLPNMGGRSSWSADGTRLAFYAGPVTNHQIYTIGTSGQDLWQLTSGSDNLGPCFSPDGEWITFTSFRDWNNEIYIMHWDGSMQTRLTYDLRTDYQPRWGP